MKDTITRRGVKKQKRLMNDTMKNLHKKFMDEGNSASYPLFCRLRPFWVLPAMEKDRQTCLCAVHANFGFVANAMKSVGLIDCSDPNVLVARSMCKSDNLKCAYSECSHCKQTGVQLCRTPEETQVQFWQWEKATKTYLRDDILKEAKVMTKVLKSMSEADVVQEFLSRMQLFKKHCFVLQQQAKAFRESKENVKDDECIVHVDFSENFNCRFHAEIQAVHFGGSHQQASLHTVVLHTANKPPVSCCTVSANLNHGPIGIWAHLKPVLSFIREQYPAVRHLLFWSDGPSSQYKQKGNFFRLCSDPFLAGFSAVSWNYFESSHGKGAVDGIGATVKRTADACVRQGHDTDTPVKLFQVVGPRLQSVKMWYIDEEDFKQSELMPSEIPVLKGTREIHQINSVQSGIIAHRKLSCFCNHLASRAHATVLQHLITLK